MTLVDIFGAIFTLVIILIWAVMVLSLVMVFVVLIVMLFKTIERDMGETKGHGPSSPTSG